MRFYEEIVARFRVLLLGAKTVPPAATVSAAPARPVIESPDPAESASRNRNTKSAAGSGARNSSNAVGRTTELLAKNPNITAAQLASSLGVSQSYARTLLRRAKIAAPEPKLMPALAPAPDLQATIRQLANRLAETEISLDRLRSAPAPRPAAAVNRRAEVLRMSAAGQSSDAIAGALGIPAGEVEFIVKVDRLSAVRA